MSSSTASGCIFGFFLFIVGAIVTMGISLGTTHWLELEFVGHTFYYGLFEICVKDECHAYASSPYSTVTFEVIQRLCIAAIIMYAATTIFIGLVLCGKTARSHGVSSVCIAVLAAILAWAGVGYFTYKVDEDDDLDNLEWEYGYSFYLAAASGVASVIAGILAVVGAAIYIKSLPQQGVVIPPQQAQGYPATNPGANYGYPMQPQGYPANNPGVNYGYPMQPQGVDAKGPGVNYGYPTQPQGVPANSPGVNYGYPTQPGRF